MNAIDTSALAYGIDARAAAKADACRALLARLPVAEVVLPWQVVVELGATGTKFDREGRSLIDVAKYIEQLVATYGVEYPEVEVVQTALELRRRWQLQYSDALIIASCKHTGVTTLYSEDLPGRVDATIEGVRVVTPLV